MSALATKPIYGMAAEFASPAALFSAAEKVRDLGFKKWDVHSPFPIHGMDGAMGLGKSWLSSVVLIGGITGLLTACALEFYPSIFINAVIVHGKPISFFTAPAFFPIMFELTVLLASFACVFALLVMNGLPQWHHPIFNWDHFEKASDNGFFMVIEARDPKFSEKKTRQLLEAMGGTHVTLVHE